MGIKNIDRLDRELPTILKILSTYSCTDFHNNDFEKRPLNFMKFAAITNQFGQFYDYFIYSDYVAGDRLLVDLNGVEWVNGKPETLIDFFDDVIRDEVNYRINRSQRSRFRTVRNYLMNLGAKRSCELDAFQHGPHCR